MCTHTRICAPFGVALNSSIQVAQEWRKQVADLIQMGQIYASKEELKPGQDVHKTQLTAKQKRAS